MHRGYAAQRLLACLTGPSPLEIPQRVCSLCPEVLAVTDTAVMLMADVNDRYALHASSPMMAELEELQYTLGEGPTAEAFTGGRPVIVPDIAEPDLRWPVFSSLADAQDLHGVFAFPLQQAGTTIGVLSLARERPGGLTDDERVECLLTADAVTLAMLSYFHGHDPNDMVNAQTAMAHMWDQQKIDEAIGMVMVQLHSDATKALARLRAAAFLRGQRLAETASDVVNHILSFAPEPPEPGTDSSPW
jgi:transcriptional regulator with GAF, ATPase, and Fis domain